MSAPKLSPIPHLWQRPGSRNWYARVRVPPGAGLRKTHLVRSLRTPDRAKAVARLPHVVAELKAEIETARRDASGHLRATPTDRRSREERDAAWWRENILRAGGEPSLGLPAALEPAWEAELEARLGPAVGSARDEHGNEREAYAPEREAATLSFIAAVRAETVGAELERYVRERGWTVRQAEKVSRAVRLLSDWLRQRPPKGDRRDAVRRREAALFVDHLREGGMAAKTANALTSALSTYWSWLERRGVVAENPWTGQSRATTASDLEAEKRPFTDAEVVRLLSGDTYGTLHDLMRVAALSGMRLGEIGALTAADAADGAFRIRVAKTAAGVRNVPIHPDLDALVQRRTEGKPPDAFLFEELRGSPSGRRGRTAKASERFTAYRRSVGVDGRAEGQRQADADFHSFRRYFITKAEQAGQDWTVIAAVVGHHRPGMTLGRYSGGPSVAQRRAVIEAVRLPEGAPVESPGGPLMGAGRHHRR